MNIYCYKHLISHRKKCVLRCRYYKRTADEEKEFQISEAKTRDQRKQIEKRKDAFIKQCRVCQGWYSDKAMKLHRQRKNKFGVVHYDKCKKALGYKLLQGDKIEHPDYIMEKNLSMDYRYYLEHQIEVPVLQIFALTMPDPNKLIENAKRNDDHRKNKTQSIKKWTESTVEIEELDKHPNAKPKAKTKTEEEKEQTKVGASEDLGKWFMDDKARKESEVKKKKHKGKKKKKTGGNNDNKNENGETIEGKKFVEQKELSHWFQ